MSSHYPPAVVRKAAAFVEALASLEAQFDTQLQANSRPVWFAVDGHTFTVEIDQTGERIVGLADPADDVAVPRNVGVG